MLLAILFSLLFNSTEIYIMPDQKLLGAYQMAQQMDEQQVKASKEQEQDEINNFLRTIGQIESSGGQNFDHNEIQHGMHKGHRAAGTYGLMPNTINEVLNRMRLEGADISDLQHLRQMPPDQMKSHVEQNPDIERRIATELAKHVMDRQGGNEEKAAYSWFQGHNLHPKEVERQKYQEHDYVKKYKKYKGE